jgi:hypothetical protein
VHLAIVVLGVELADEAQVRLIRVGVDHGAGRPDAPAELCGAENGAVDRDDLDVGHTERLEGACGEHEGGVSTLIALRYPNGRVHRTALDRELKPGDRFELYRRVWVAGQWTTGRSRLGGGKHVDQPRLVCAPAGSVPLSNGRGLPW